MPKTKLTRIIAVANQKGGVGKTTVVVNLAAGLEKEGCKVLVIDMDGQANATISFGIDEEKIEKSIVDVLSGEVSDLDSIAWERDNIFVIPATMDLQDIEEELSRKLARESLLKDKLGPFLAEKDFDFVLMDCPPSITSIPAINALVAAKEVFIPVDIGFFSLRGIRQLTTRIKEIQLKLNPGLTISGFIVNKFDKRNALSEKVRDTMRKNFTDQLFQTAIRINVDLVRASIARQTIFQFAPRSSGAEDFANLTQEVLRWIRLIEKR